MPPRRLPAPPVDRTTRAPLVQFTFDGHAYDGIEGEPLAVSLLAADRPILSRSFRFHRPRGLMCSTGQCGWCECEVDGRPSVRSCRVPVRAGLVARGEHALPSVDRDLLSLLGLTSRWIPPTFYHHRFLRPRALRQRYLAVLRWFGGRGRLGTGERVPPPGRSARRVELDVLVVGGGRAGLMAALGAAETARRVVLIEAETSLGGAGRVDSGIEQGLDAIGDLANQARHAGVEILAGVAAIGWYHGMVAAIGEGLRYELRARTIVAATGSYDRVPLVPGADRPGVMSARMVVELVDRYRVLPGERAMLVGAGPELTAAGQRLAGAGAEVVGPVTAPSLRRILGRRRVSGAVHAVAGRERRERVDLVVFADRSPNIDLVLAAGAAVERRGGVVVPVCDPSGATSLATLFVAGSAAGRPTVTAADAEMARLAGQAAGLRAAAGSANAQGNQAAGSPRPARAQESTGAIVPGVAAALSAAAVPAAAVPAAASASDALVCFCEDVHVREIRAEQRAGYADPELIKRRTGALTGPCQGKYCLQAFACVTGPAADGPMGLPTARPPLRPVRLGDLVPSNDATVAGDATR